MKFVLVIAAALLCLHYVQAEVVQENDEDEEMFEQQFDTDDEVTTRRTSDDEISAAIRNDFRAYLAKDENNAALDESNEESDADLFKEAEKIPLCAGKCMKDPKKIADLKDEIKEMAIKDVVSKASLQELRDVMGSMGLPNSEIAERKDPFAVTLTAGAVIAAVKGAISAGMLARTAWKKYGPAIKRLAKKGMKKVKAWAKKAKNSIKKGWSKFKRGWRIRWGWRRRRRGKK